MANTLAFFQTTAQRILGELAATDTLPTAQSIRLALKEDYGSYLSHAEITGVIAAALALLKKNFSSEAEADDHS